MTPSSIRRQPNGVGDRSYAFDVAKVESAAGGAVRAASEPPADLTVPAGSCQ
ncbi:hypothetical protein [Nocardia otitidiscaviarum]|uniref:hypothetical protein n=1 Tax=Nocardia otitidiscaviarum TaxID=1823 RepID=UPI0024574573|nr:hypothetical protein [Nocardia otitidiscaviarum]